MDYLVKIPAGQRQAHLFLPPPRIDLWSRPSACVWSDTCRTDSYRLDTTTGLQMVLDIVGCWCQWWHYWHITQWWHYWRHWHGGLSWRWMVWHVASGECGSCCSVQMSGWPRMSRGSLTPALACTQLAETHPWGVEVEGRQQKGKGRNYRRVASLPCCLTYFHSFNLFFIVAFLNYFFFLKNLKNQYLEVNTANIV